MAVRKRTLKAAHDLAEAGLVAPERARALEAVAARYAIAISPAVTDLIDPSAQDDPIARQFVPSASELETHPLEQHDPIGDEPHTPVTGIVHRYPDRVLLKLAHVCPVYCRFCFRREMVGPGKDQALSPEALKTALSYIAMHPEIWEVILTGGDPFMLSARRIADVTSQLSSISHVKVLRWHTRMPIAAPERITPAVVKALKTDKAVYVAVHVNHARELSDTARAACACLVDAGIPVLSQSVLIKGVNDDVAALEALMRALVETRIKPYYLHHMDLAPGTAHLRTTIAEGQSLVKGLRARASGLCQPHYVLDIPGGYSKALLSPCDAEEDEHGYRLRDAQGARHAYPAR